MKQAIQKKSQCGNITSEYLLATVVILTILFGARFEDKAAWQLFLEAFQNRHDNYTQTISNLDMVDVKKDKVNGKNK